MERGPGEGLSVLARVARNEWRLLRREPGLRWLLPVCALLALYAAWNGLTVQQAQQRERDQALRPAREELDALRRVLDKPAGPSADPSAPDPRSPRYVGGMAQPLALPLLPLMPVAVGQADLLPGLAAVSIWTSPQTAMRNYEIQNPTHLLAGRFDLAFALVWLFPLMVLALSYDALAAERDDGRLGLLVSHPLRLSTLLLGKLAARFTLVATLGLGLGALALAAAGVRPDTPGVTADLAWLALLLLAYAAFWFALAAGVAALRLSAASSAVTLATLWLLLVVIAPALISVAAGALHPAPSRLELLHATREATNRATPQAERLVEGHYSDHPELAPAAGDPDLRDFMTRFLTVESFVQREVSRVAADHDERLARRQALVARLRFLSPALVLHEALTDLAGTHTSRQLAFRAQVLAFLERWKGYFSPRIYAHRTLSRTDWDALPRFAFVEEPARARHARAAAALAGLLGPTLLVALAAGRGLRRYRVAG